MRRFLVFPVLSLLLTLSCGGGAAPKDRLVIGIESNPTTFDPRLAADSYSQKITGLIFNGLMKTDENLELKGDLAEKYERTSDRIYKFYLREGVKFHSGRSLTADDVVYTFISIMEGTVPSIHKDVFQKVKSVTAESPRVVIVELKENFAPFLTMMKLGIVPKEEGEMLKDQFGLHPIGTGPYKFVEFKSDAHVLLEANALHYGGVPKLPFLEFRVLKDDNVRVLQLMKGSVDIIQNAIPPDMLDLLAKRDGLQVESGPSIVFDYMGVNLKDPVLQNKDVRRAIAYAINRGEIIKYKWRGFAREANSVLAPFHWAFSKDVTAYSYNPNEAKRILDAAGFKDPDGDGPKPRFFLTYKTSTQKSRIDIANLIAEQLKKVGIGVTVTPFEWGTFFRDIQSGNFQIYSLSWVGVNDPDIYYNIFHSSQMPPAGANRNRYSNAEIDRLTSAGRTTVGLNERKKIYAKVQNIVSKDLPYIPLWYQDNVVTRRSNVGGYVMRPDASFKGVVDVTKE